MATKLEDRTDPARLYDEDFYAWAKQQADVLRTFEATRPNLPLDFAHLIEEVEDLGESLVRAAKSQLRRVIQHLLKLEYSPADRPRQQWLKSVDLARLEIDDVLTASVRNAVTPLLGKLFENARDLAKRDLLSYGEPDAARALPETCPYTLDQMLDKTWYPTNRHGLIDDPL
jgi:hypothetical protein